jgi:hypothetical protein
MSQFAAIVAKSCKFAEQRSSVEFRAFGQPLAEIKDSHENHLAVPIEVAGES